jgi:integrase
MAHRESPTRRTNPSGREVWVARYTSSDGKRRSAGTFKLKRDAQEAINNAYQRPQDPTTVEAYLERWLKARPRSERTDRTNEGRIRNVVDVVLEGTPLGGWQMRDLRRRHRDALAALLLTEQGRSPGGARNILRTLSAMFEDAITDELAETNPWRGARLRDDDRRALKGARELRVWTWEQMHSFASASGFHEPMIRTLSDCGLRIGEIFALKWRSMTSSVLVVSGTSWEGRVVEGSREKNHNRNIPIPPGCLILLKQMPPRIDTPWLFPTPRGTMWRYSNFKRQVWQPIVQRSGMDPTPHEFRHSYVTLLRAAGVDPADLADVAGHSVDMATSRYTHPLRRSDDEIRRVVG